MPYTVTSTPQAIDFGASGPDEILQNVRTILTTIQGTVPLDRALGIDPSPLDKPGPIARAKTIPLVIRSLKMYEPRVTVQNVDFIEDEQGRLVVSVTIDLVAGVVV